MSSPGPVSYKMWGLDLGDTSVIPPATLLFGGRSYAAPAVYGRAVPSGGQLH